MISFETARRNRSPFFFGVCLLATSLLAVAAHPARILTGIDRSLFTAGAAARADSDREIVFITDDVEEWETLAAAVHPGAEVVRLDRNADGVEAITSTLKDRRGLAGIHIVSHGAAGQITLGSQTLSSDNIDRNLGALEKWGQALSPRGAIFLYGCDVAWGEIGRRFVEGLARRTHADVAASSNPTGAEGLGGDWRLEVRTGAVRDADVFDVYRVKSYEHILQTTLSAGDAVILSFSQGTNTFKWAPLRDLSAGTVIKFTDRGWITSGSFFATSGSEGFFSLTLTSSVAAGTVGSVTITPGSPNGTVIPSGITGTTAVTGWTSGSTVFTQGGDTLLIYQGAENSPTFIFGVNFTSVVMSASGTAANGWSTNSPPQTSSQLPSGLTSGTTAKAFLLPPSPNPPPNTNEDYRFAYTGPVTAATAALWLGRIVGTGLDIVDPGTDSLPNWTKQVGSDPSPSFGSQLLIASPPTVTDARISLNKTLFHNGETVTATWNNTSSGDNNSNIASVTMNFSAFGGSSSATASNSSGTWTASATINKPSGGTNLNVSVTATDNIGNATTTADTSNATVDVTAPTVTDARISINKTLFRDAETITATWNNTAGGDNNNDIASVTVNFSAFGGGAAVAASNSSGTRTASATINKPSGGTNLNVSVTATDNAGNATTTADTSNATVDATAPTISSVLLQSPSSSPTNADTVTFRISFSEPLQNVDASDFRLTGTVASSGTVTSVTPSDSPPSIFDVAVGGAALASANGSLSLYFADGQNIKDLAGNALTDTIPTDTNQSYFIDNSVSAPGTPDLTDASDTGSSDTDNITNDTTPTFTGTGEESATVTLFKDLDNDGVIDTSPTNETLGTAVVSGGVWTITPSAQTAGTYNIKARQTDQAGNVSTISAALSITIDTTAPGVPTTLNLSDASDSGSSATDNYTNVTTPTFTGNGEANATVTLFKDTNSNNAFDSGESLGTGTVSGTTWSITSSALTGNVYSIRSFQTDVAGNISGVTAALSLTVDVAALTPGTPDLSAGSDSGTSSTDSITNVTTPTFTGTGETNSTLTLFKDDNSNNALDSGESLGTATVASGAWSVTSSALTAGTYSIRAIETDKAGNVSNVSSALSLTVDTSASAPGTPDLSAASDTGSSSTDNLTKATTPTFTGTGENGATVTLFKDTNSNDAVDSGESLGTATVSSGAWSIASSSLSAGAYSVKAIQTDLAGNTSSASSALGITVDTAANAPGTPDLNASSDTGASSTDNDTSDTTPTFDGTGETGATVTLFKDTNSNGAVDSGESLGTATVTSGAWSITSSSLAAGTYSIKAIQTDVAGNTSSASSGLSVTISGLAAPGTPDMTSGTDSGSSSTDNITNNTTPAFTGTGLDSATVTLFKDTNSNGAVDSGESLGTATVSSGTWSITSSSLTAGTYSVKAIQDLAGSTSGASGALSVTIDTTAAAPGTPDLSAGSDSGTSSTDNITNNTTPTLTGTGETGATVTLFQDANSNGAVDSGESLGTATVSSGAWSIASSSLSAGAYNVKAIQTDLAGNTSSASSALSITVDTAANAPGTPDLNASSDTGASSTDNDTSDTTPTFDGTGETGATVTLFKDTNSNGAVDSGESLGTATVTSGAWSITSSSLAAGTYSIKAIQTDVAGNTSSASSGLSVTISGLAAPGTPDMTSGTDSGSSSTDNITTNNTPAFTGTGEDGATVTLFKDTNSNGAVDSGESLGTATVSSGTWSITSSSLTAGTYSVKAIQDLAGNTSSASSALGITVDTAANAPGTPDLNAASDTGASSTDNDTSDTTPTFDGTGETGATVTLFKDTNSNGAVDSGESLGTATVTSGAWSITSSSLAAGTYSIKAIQTDVAGNTSSASSGLSVTISGLAAPGTPDMTSGTDSGSSSTDNITNNTTPAFTGTGLDSATVTLFKDTNSNGAVDSGESLGTATVSSGTWSITSSSLTAGTYSVKAIQDLAGSTSGASSALSVTIDTSAAAPGTPDLSASSDSGSSSTDNITNNTTPTLTGTGENGATVTLFKDTNSNDAVDSGESLGTATVSSGAWSIASSSLSAGAYSIKAIQTDLAGNTSGASSALGITVDTAANAPGTPDLNAASDTGASSTDNDTSDTTPTFDGTGETGATVTLFKDTNSNGAVDSGESLGTATVTSGAWSITSSSLAAGTYNIKAIQTDVAGNTSSASSGLSVTISGLAAPGTPDMTSGTDSGSSSTDNITTNNTPAFTGTGEDGATVTLFKDTNSNGAVDSGESLGTATVSSGTWSITSSSLTAGTYSVKAIQDLAGNTSSASSALGITVDTAANAPGTPDLNAASDTGASSTDNDTSDTTPTFDGTGETGATVTLFKDTNSNGAVDSGESLGTATVTSGAWSITSSALAAGTYSIKAIQTDVAGNTSSASSGLSVTISGLAAPGTPDMTSGTDSGSSSTDNITSNTTPAFTGTGEDGAAVTLFKDTNSNGAVDSGESLGTATVSSGSWSITSSSLTAGTYSVKAIQDLAGSTSGASSALSITVDTSASAPGTPDLSSGSDTGTSSTDNLTNATTPTFTGTGENGATVTLFKDTNSNDALDSGESLGTATVSSSAWSITSSSLSAGTYSVKSIQTDLAGNTSSASSALSITVDTSASAPSTPDLNASSDTGASSTDNVTSDTTPTFDGTGETGATVTLFKDTNSNGAVDSGESLGTATVTAGAWSITSSSLAAGTYSIKSIQTDVAGNTSSASSSLSVTISALSAPGTPDMTSGTDSGSSSTDNITSNTTPAFTGTGIDGATVTLFKDTNSNDALDSGESLGTAIVSSGTWSITSSSLTAGTYSVKAIQDLAGSTSGTSSALSITIDTAAAGPGTPDLSAGSDSGTSSTDNITNATTPTFTGTGENGATVTLFRDTNSNDALDSGESLGTATVSSGSWSIASSSLSAGAYSVKAIQTDLAGNTSSASSALSITIDNTTPILSIGSPSAADTVAGPISYTVTYSGADSISLVAGDVTLNKTGTANGNVAVSGTGTTTRTITIDSIIGDGTLGITIAAGTATDTAGNSAASSSASTTFNVDNMAPTISIGSPSTTLTRNGPVTYTITYSNATTISLVKDNVTLNKTNTANGNVTVSGTGTTTRTVTIDSITGNGTLGITIAAATATDTAANAAGASGASTTFTADNTAPTVTSIMRQNPTSAVTSADSVTFRITFSEAVQNVDATDFTVSGTAGSDGSVGTVSTVSTMVYDVPVNGLTSSNGTIGLGFAGGQNVADTAGNALTNTTAETNQQYTIDNTAPALTIGAPSAADTISGPITYTITYSNADFVTLLAGNVTLNKTGTADGTVAVTGSGTATRTVTISSITGNGTLGISIASGTASDTAGNSAAASSASTTFNVDDTAPTLSIGAPSTTLTRGGPVSYTITYSNATLVTLTDGNVTLNKTGTANGNVEVTGTGTTTRTVTINSITGNGTLGISIAAATASDAAGNTAAASGAGTTFTTDNTAPTITSVVRRNPTAATTNADSVTFRVTFSEAVQNVDTADFSVTGTAAADGTAGTVTPVSALIYDVPVNGIAGSNGTIGLGFAGSQNVADTASNPLTNTTPGTTEQYTIDNAAPALSIGAPSAADTISGPITYTITYSNTDAVTLEAGNITLNKTGTADGTVAVTGSGTATRTVTISSITGNGTLGISIAAGTATDTAGNAAGASGPGTTFNVDNVAPTLSIGSPSTTLTQGGPVTYTLTYSNATAVTLTDGNVTLNKTGTANGTVAVTGSGTTTRTVTISSITGDGTLGVSIAAATATDTAGNSAASSASSPTFTVDNTAPAITDPKISINKTIFKDGAAITATWNNTAAGDNNSDVASVTIDFSAFGGGAAVAATNTAGSWSAGAVVARPAGGTNLNVSVKAVDIAGNQAATADTSNATVDNIAPTLVIGPPSGPVTSAGPITYVITYAGADTITLSADNVAVSSTGTATGVVSISGDGNASRTITIGSITGDGTLSISIAAATAADNAGNLAAAAGPGASFTVDNKVPTLSIGTPGSAVTGHGPVSFTITYQDAAQVTLAAAAVTLNKTGTANGSVEVTGSGATTRTVTITGITGDGTLGINIAAGTASDLANNMAGAAGPSATFLVDNTAPTPVITSTESSPSAAPTIRVSVAFGENVTGFDLTDIVITNGTASALQGGNSTFAFDVTPAADGTVTVRIPAGAAQDSAGNGNVASNQFSMVSLRVAPKPAMTSTENSPTKAAAIPLIVNFGAVVTGFTLSDVQVTGGTASGFVDSGSGQFSLTITPSADGTIVVNIPSGAAQSTSGVDSAAADAFSIVSDRTVAVPVISGLNPTTNALTGTGESGASLRISTNAGATLCTTTVLSTGAWSCTLAAGADLSQEVTIVQTDIAGNVSAPAHFTADDGDGIPIDVELKGPNQITDSSGNKGADANGDGMVDALQPNVATMTNPETNEPVSVSVQPTNSETGKPSTCSKFDFVQALKIGDALKQGGSVPNDPGFQYPFGLLNYAVKCASAGSEEVLTVVFYFYQTESLSKLGVTSKDYVVRKYTATGSGFQDPHDLGVKVVLEDDPALAAKAGVANVIKMTLTLKDNGAGDDNPVQNFVLDPVGVALPAPGSVTLQMTANKQQVSVGDIVQYQLRANNATDAALPDISINDLLPAGFRIVPGSARAVVGSTATPLTMTGVEPNVRIGSFAVPGKSNVTVSFSALVGSGVQSGRKMNSATAVTAAGPVSLTATLSIDVVSDPILDRMTILGRVFHDRNGNGQMDDGEEGLRGARLITTDGEWIVVDEFGRYNYPGVEAGPNARGRNFILKVEEDSLPKGTTFTTENPRVERITGGAITRIDFGVRLPEGNNAASSAGNQEYVRVATNGRLWLSKAPSERTPRLAILAPEAIYLDTGARPTAAAAFWFDSNFSSFIDHWELNFYASDDDGFLSPLYVLSGNKLPIGTPVSWNGDLTSSKLEDHRTLRYRLKIVDSKGNTGWTVPGTIGVLRATLAAGSEPQSAASWFEQLNGRNDLSGADIALPPGLVTIMGEGLPAGGTITIGSDVYPIDASGRVALDRRQLPGNFQFATTVKGTSGDTIAQAPLSGELIEDDFSLIGLADLTVGGNSLSGAIDLVRDDDHFDEDIFVDGRVAFYLKGRVSGRYLISAQLDTGDDKIGNLLDGANGRNPRELFRRIDPDRYYPVYGDNSTRGRDVDTQGKLYVRLDWDKSSVLWGNFNTGFTGTKLAEYNRGLYGAKVDIRSVAATSNGDEKTVIKAFASEPNTSASHDEFEGTGGSLYYLRHQDLVLGSMKLAVEVRELSSDRVRERIDLRQGSDYETDEFQGRLILTAPLRTVADKRLLTVIRDEALEGDRVVLVADYEYVSGNSFGANNINGGVRARQSVGDHVTVGGTYIREDNSPTDFEKRAGDVTVRGGKNTFVSVEYAETTATQSVDFNTSSDGGLTFVERTPASVASRGGNATSVDARLDFADYFGKKISSKIGAWFRDQDAGFDALTFTTSASRRRNFGFEGTWDATSAFRLSARYSQDETGLDRLKTAGIQGDYRFNKSLSLGMEYQHRESTTPAVTGMSLFSSLPHDVSGDIVGARLRWRATDRWSTFLSGQYGANLATSTSSRNNLFGVGTEYRVNEKLSLLGEVFKGGRGDGERAGVQYNYRQGSAAYLNYTTENSLGTGGGLTLGQRSELTDKLKIFQEHRFDWQSRDPQRTQSYGLGYSFTSNWTVGAETQRGRAKESNQWRNRDAYSVFSSWRNSRSSVNNKLEYRLDDSLISGTMNRARQWVTANRFTFKITEDVSLMSKLDYSITRGATSGVSRGRFGEFDLGAAYRPVKNNRLNMLGMYSFVDNLTPQQIPGAPSLQGSFFDDRFHVASIDGTYALTSRWEAGGKLAWKRTADREDRDSGTFFGSDTTLSIARLRYHFVHKWNGMVEFRQISVSSAQDNRRGFLSAIGYDFTKNLQGGMGYNFTDFNDDLKRLDFRAHGWFLNMSFKY